MAKTSMKIKQQRPAKFSTREYKPLQNLRTSACIFKKIRYLPYLLQRISIQGTDPWCEESKLVGRKQIKREQAVRQRSSLVPGPSRNLARLSRKAKVELG